MSWRYWAKNQEYAIRRAEEKIQADYWDRVSVDIKNKDLLKFWESTAVGTSKTTIMTLPSGQLAETFVSTNAITTVISSATTDNGVVLNYEWHTISGGDLTFVTWQVTLNASDSQTAVTLPTAVARITRAYFDTSNTKTVAVGNISFYEWWATSWGVPTDATTVHMILPIWESQTQKCSTSVSSIDYWIITWFTVSVLEKASCWVQARIEIKPVSSSVWLPITQYVWCSDAAWTVVRQFEVYKIVPKNHDVRLVGIANTSSIHVSWGIAGRLAKVIG